MATFERDGVGCQRKTTLALRRRAPHAPRSLSSPGTLLQIPLLYSNAVADQTPVWAGYDVLRATEIARLPAADRGPWENRGHSPRVCFSCRSAPATRDDESLPPNDRAGVGFYTCKGCRSAAVIRANTRPFLTPVARYQGVHFAGANARLAHLNASSKSDPRLSALSPNVTREQGLCWGCKERPALLRKRRPGDEELRALAEIRDTTVARLSTGQCCARCKPASRQGHQRQAGVASGVARRRATWQRDQDILNRPGPRESSRAIGKAMHVDHSTVLRVQKRDQAGRLGE